MFNGDRHLESGFREHIHQGVNGEFVYFTAHDVTDPEPGYAHKLGGLGLGHAVVFDKVPDFYH